MYKVTLYDRGSYPNGGQVLLDTSSQNLGVRTATYEGKLNEAGSFNFNVTAGNPLYDTIEPMKTYVSVEEEGDEIFWGRVIMVRKTPLTGTKQITCEGAYAFLLDAELPPDAEEVSMTPAEYFAYCIDTFNEAIGNDPARKLLVGDIDVTGSAVETTYKNGSWTEIQNVLKSKVIDQHDGLISIVRDGTDHYIDWVTQVGVMNPQPIQLGKNVTNQSSSESGEDIFTYVRAVGKDKIEYGPVLLNADMEAKYGKIIRTINFGDVESVEELQTKTTEYIAKLQGRLSLSVDINFVDMHYYRPMGKNLWPLTSYVGVAYNPPVGTVFDTNLSDIQLTNNGNGSFSAEVPADGRLVFLIPVADLDVAYMSYQRTGVGGRCTLGYLDSELKVINAVNNTQAIETYSHILEPGEQEDAAYVYFVFTSNQASTITIRYPQVEAGSDQTDYEPYEINLKVHLGDVFTNLSGYEGVKYTAAAISRDLLNPANDKMTPKTDKDLMPSVSSSGANRGSSSGGSSGGRRSLSGGSSHWYKHIHETEEDLSLTARNIEISANERINLIANQVSINAQNISSVSATANQLNDKWTEFTGTGFYQNRESINTVAGKFQVDNQGTLILKQGTNFKIDINGSSTNVGTLLNLHDNRIGEYGQILAAYKGSYAYQNDHELGAIVGHYLIDTTVDPNNPWVNVTPSGSTEGINPKELGWYEDVNNRYVKTNDTTVVASKQYYIPGTNTKLVYDVGTSGGGYRIRENGVEYGVYTDGNLTGGLIVDKINDGSVTAKIKAARVILGEDLSNEDLATWAAGAKNGTGVFAKYFTAQNFNAIVADIELATFDSISTTGDITVGGALYIDVDGQPEQINVLDITKSVDGNTLTVYKTDGSSFDFRKAVSLRGAWNGSTYSVSATSGAISGTVPSTTVYQSITGTPNPSETVYANVYKDNPNDQANIILTNELTLEENVSAKKVSLKYLGLEKGAISTEDTYKAGQDSVDPSIKSAVWSWANDHASVTLSPQNQTFTSPNITGYTLSGNPAYTHSGVNHSLSQNVVIVDENADTVTTLQVTLNARAAYQAGYNETRLEETWSDNQLTVSKTTSASGSVRFPQTHIVTGDAQITWNETEKKFQTRARVYVDGVERYTQNYQFSSAISTGIEYDSTTHKYTAKALSGTTTILDSAEGDTQAYLDGQTDLINAGGEYSASANNVYHLNRYITDLTVNVPTGTSLGGTWSNGTLTVTATPQGTTETFGIADNTDSRTSWSADKKTATVSVYAATGASEVAIDTGKRLNVNATEAYEAGQQNIVNAGGAYGPVRTNGSHTLNQYVTTLTVDVDTGTGITGLTIDTANHQIKTSTSSADQSVTITCEKVARSYTASTNTYVQVFQSKADSSTIATVTDTFVATDAYEAGYNAGGSTAYLVDNTQSSATYGGDLTPQTYATARYIDYDGTLHLIDRKWAVLGAWLNAQPNSMPAGVSYQGELGYDINIWVEYTNPNGSFSGKAPGGYWKTPPNKWQEGYDAGRAYESGLYTRVDMPISERQQLSSGKYVYRLTYGPVSQAYNVGSTLTFYDK